MKINALTCPDIAAFHQPSSLKESFRLALRKKTTAGFTIAEGLGWLSIHIALSVVVMLCFHIGNVLTGNEKELLVSIAYFTGVQALAMYPFWQLFFVQRKSKRLSQIIIYQFVAGIMYAFLITMLMTLTNTWTGHGSMNESISARYVLGTLFLYFTHQLIFAAYHFWKQTQSCTAHQTALKKEVEQFELAALKTQIEPHFLFNALNAINASVPPSLEETRVMIAQLADTFRYALQVNEHQQISLKEEIRFLKTWLSLESYRFGNRLQVVYKVNDECLQYDIPPMILQPLIENALKHGLTSKRQGGQITIECDVKGDALLLSVSDTGIGYSGDLVGMFGKGIGLQNIRRRLQLLFNETLTVERNKDGLRFSFSIPLAFSGIKTELKFN